MRPFLLFLIFCVFNVPGKAQKFGGNPASVKWLQIDNDRVRVIFPKGIDSQAIRIANMMTFMADTTAKTIGGEQKKWNIVLQNQTTVPNAYVRMAPRMSELYMTPPQNSFSTGSIRWDDNLIIHENRHIQQLSNFNKGFTRVFSVLLGQEGQLLANGITIPDYFFEGDAVWQETLLSAQGRGRMPAFYNGIKSLWIANKNYSWMKLRNGSLRDYTPDHYTLGYLLTAYGYEKYGDNFWNKVTNDAVRFKKLFYPFNQAIQQHAGITYKQYRVDAMEYFKAKSLAKNKEGVEKPDFITPVEINNVTDYQFPHFISNDSIIVTKSSYKKINAFYLITNNKEIKLRVRDIGIDDYFSYKNGKIVYAAYQSDPRWGNRDYSVLNVLDVYTKKQQQITFKSKYFSPELNEAGNEVLAVQVNPDGTNNLCRLDATNGKLIASYPNPMRYFFTQSKYIDDHTIVSAVRTPAGTMTLLKTDLTTGDQSNLTPFSFNIVGYPFVKNDTVFFSAMYQNADKVFALTLSNNKLFQVTDNVNGVYQPVVNNAGELVAAAFTADGYRLAKFDVQKTSWTEIAPTSFSATSGVYYIDSLNSRPGAGSLYTFKEDSVRGSANNQVTKYPHAKHLFNFHSWRPLANEPEYGYALYSDNVLSSFSNSISYTINRADRSHTLGFNAAFAGWFPVLGLGIESDFNRTIDTAIGKQATYNTARLKAGVSIPLQFVGGRTNKYLNFGGGYNLEQYYYRGAGKNIFSNEAIKYMNSFFSFSNVSQQARQHINPRWAQSVSVSYRDAFNFRNSQKLVTHANLYFPGLFANHSLVINGAFQRRDTLPDLFSKTFSYSRGYEALSTPRMFKIGVNYHFPIVYPDWGFGNLVYFQRIRANAFYDHTEVKARVNNLLTNLQSRSTGTEVYFDAKIWNALPISFGVRFSHLLDRDLLNPTVKNRWEVIIPIGLIPN